MTPISPANKRAVVGRRLSVVGKVRPAECALSGLEPRASGHRSRRGTTLIEMNLVIILLLIFAVMIVPRFAAIRQSRSVRDTEAAIARLPLEARNEARRSQVPVTMQVQDGALVLTRTPVGGDAQEFKRVNLGDGFRVEQANLNTQPSDTSSWQWVVYPDGSSDSGGLQFTEGSSTRSLVLSSDGKIQWTQDVLPDSSQDKWQAGDLETTQTTTMQ